MRNFLVGLCLTISSFVSPVIHAAVDDSRPAHHLYSPTHPTADKHPLLVVLHGYGVPGDLQEYYYSFKERVDTEQFYLLVPEGRRDSSGKPYWDVLFTDKTEVGVESDLTYIKNLIAETVAKNNIDPERIFLIGHSNGGYMASVIACAMGDVMKGVASISGSMYFPTKACKTGRINKIIHMCGTTDSCITPAESATKYWADKFKCEAGVTDQAPSQDFDWSIVGKETVATQWNKCAGGSKVLLWEMLDGKHIPYMRGQFAQEVVNYFMH